MVTCGDRKLRRSHTYQGGGRVFLGGMVITDKPGEAGEEAPPARLANGSDRKNQSSKWSWWAASRTGSRAFVRTLQYRGVKYLPGCLGT